MVTETLSPEHDASKLGRYLFKMNRRLQQSRFRAFDFDERISVAGTGWFFDRQLVLQPDQTGGCRPTNLLPDFMAYAVNEYGGIDNLLRFLDIKVDFALSLS